MFKLCIKNYKIDTIINCAAYNYVDRAETEKELCYKLNAEAPATLANIAAEIGALPNTQEVLTIYIFELSSGLFITCDTNNSPSYLALHKLIVDVVHLLQYNL